MRFGLLASLLAFFLALGVAGTAYAGSALGDTDNDGVDDFFDNCTVDSNVSQEDSDSDGCGNRCDGDFNQSANTNGADFNLFRAGFLDGGPGAIDMNSSGNPSVLSWSVYRLKRSATFDASICAGRCLSTQMSLQITW